MWIFLVIVIILLVWAVSTTNNQDPSWHDCTYCKKCDESYDRSGLNVSIYTCPSCGVNTEVGCSRRWIDGKWEVISAYTGKSLRPVELGLEK